MSSLGQTFLDSAIKRLTTYKQLGEGTFAQLDEDQLYWSPNEASNSIAVIIRHLSGNMISRWTNFLTEDGEKEGRNRESEFGLEIPREGREALLAKWQQGWTVLFDTLKNLSEQDLSRTIHIRHEPLVAIDAINRQLAHYPHHVGQIVYIGKMLKDRDWQSLSIPRGGSSDFNRQMQNQHAADNGGGASKS